MLEEKDIIIEADSGEENFKITLPKGHKNLYPGILIVFGYQGKNAHDKEPRVLLLNPSYQGLMHGLNISYMKNTVVVKLMAYIKQLIYKNVVDTKKSKVYLDILKQAEKGPEYARNKKNLLLLRAAIQSGMPDPYQFYHQHLKRFLDREMRGISVYRTYKVKNISHIRISNEAFYAYKG